jgi:hypothetical protein
MTAVIGVVIALLIAFVLLSIFFLVAYKQQKLCFKGEAWGQGQPQYVLGRGGVFADYE